MLLPEKRKALLKLFFEKPFVELHIREIARQANISTRTVTTSVNLLMNQKFFIKRELTGITFIKANMESDLLMKVFEIFEVEKKLDWYRNNKKLARITKSFTDSVIRKTNQEIQIVILYGSAARNKWTNNSDLDVLMVTSKKTNELLTQINLVKKEISSLVKISPIIVSFDKYIEGYLHKRNFFDEIWKDRIVLYNEYIFWKIMRELKI